MTSMDKIGVACLQLTHEHLDIYQNIADRRVCKGFHNALNATYLARQGVCDNTLNWVKDRKGVLDNLKKTIDSNRTSIDDIMKECIIRDRPCINLTRQLKNSLFSVSNFFRLTSIPISDPNPERTGLNWQLEVLKSERAEQLTQFKSLNRKVEEIPLNKLANSVGLYMMWEFFVGPKVSK